MDFPISAYLFYALVNPRQDAQRPFKFFVFEQTRVRWAEEAENTPQRSSRDMRNTILCSDAGRLDFPASASAVVRWCDFAQDFVECENPAFLREFVEAPDIPTARRILREAKERATAILAEKVDILLNTPDSAKAAKFIAKQARDDAREVEQAIESCRIAFQKTLEENDQNDLISGLRARGLENATIDYASFMQLTTFGATHLGDEGFYSLRKHGERVVGIDPGMGVPAYHPLFGDEELQASANHQRDAMLPLPTSASELVTWVYKQAGGVELATPDTEEIPVEATRWIDAVAKIAASGPQLSAGIGQMGAKKAPGKKNGVRKDAMAIELETLDIRDKDPKGVMCVLQAMAGKTGSCVTQKTKSGVKWKAIDGTEKELDLEGLKKRLSRRNAVAG